MPWPQQNNRGWEMHRQQQVIEQKRREIEQKRLAAAAAAKSGAHSSGSAAAQSAAQETGQPGSLSAATNARRMFEAHKQSYRTPAQSPNAVAAPSEPPTRTTPPTTNAFENDGSFLEMFRQMQQKHAATLKPKPADLPSRPTPATSAPQLSQRGAADDADGDSDAATAGDVERPDTDRPADGQGEPSQPKSPASDTSASGEKKRKRSRWSDAGDKVSIPPPSVADISMGGQLPLAVTLSQRSPELIAYAQRVFGSVDLTEAQWTQCQDQMKMNVLLEDIKRKKAKAEELATKGKVKYEYDSDEDTDGGTWEHKRRKKEMWETQMKADELTMMNEGKHHIGDFLPPDELERFMENWRALKEDREPDLSDYKNFKIKEDNMGFQMLKKMGWTEGAGLGSDGSGITAPIAQKRTLDTAGVGTSAQANLNKEDSEFDAYRKRMMLAYKFRPNPLNNPRREYY